MVRKTVTGRSLAAVGHDACFLLEPSIRHLFKKSPVMPRCECSSPSRTSPLSLEMALGRGNAVRFENVGMSEKENSQGRLSEERIRGEDSIHRVFPILCASRLPLRNESHLVSLRAVRLAVCSSLCGNCSQLQKY